MATTIRTFERPVQTIRLRSVANPAAKSTIVKQETEERITVSDKTTTHEYFMGSDLSGNSFRDGAFKGENHLFIKYSCDWVRIGAGNSFVTRSDGKPEVMVLTEYYTAYLYEILNNVELLRAIKFVLERDHLKLDAKDDLIPIKEAIEEL